MMAGRYARALALTVGEKDGAALTAAGAELDLLARVIELDPALARFLDSPTTREADKSRTIETLAARARLSERARRFLTVVVANRRAAALPAIAGAFAEIRDRQAGIVPAEATVAVALGDAERKGLEKALETMTGLKVRLSVTVDPEIVGGVRTRIGSRVYDGTVQSHLRALHRRMTEAH
jgi:F-type H+-transporting ATPase subunit delta